MAKRRPKARTFDGVTGAAVSGIMDPADSGDFIHTVVPNDTPTPMDGSVVAVARDLPSPGQTTWYSPTTAAIASGRVQAAVDTLEATGAQLTQAGESIIGAASAITQNFIPILIGLAALYLLFEFEKSK